MIKDSLNKKAFTLVELIVTITILIILGIIGFLSYQNYTVYSRDVARITDLNNMKSVLEYTFTESGRYPKPDDGEEITYSGAEVWIQGTFGKETRRKTKRLDTFPLDPLTLNQYTYSVSNTENEYELGGVFEGDEVALSSSPLKKGIIGELYADKSDFKAYITGNYNGKLLKVSTGGTDYVLAIPSMISSDTSILDIGELLSQNKLSYNGYKNLPASYGAKIDSSGLNFVNSEKLLVWSGSFENLRTQESDRLFLTQNFQEAYSGTTLKAKSMIAKVLNILPDKKVELLMQGDELVTYVLKLKLGEKSVGGCGNTQHGKTANFYTSSTVPFGSNCSGILQTFICYGGKIRNEQLEIIDTSSLSTTCSTQVAQNCTSTLTSGYTHSELNHEETGNGIRTTYVENGSITDTSTVSCYDGTDTVSNENPGSLVCDEGYAEDDGDCLPICSIGGPTPCVTE